MRKPVKMRFRRPGRWNLESLQYQVLFDVRVAGSLRTTITIVSLKDTLKIRNKGHSPLVFASFILFH